MLYEILITVKKARQAPNGRIFHFVSSLADKDSAIKWFRTTNQEEIESVEITQVDNYLNLGNWRR